LAQSSAHTIDLTDLENAISSAVEQVKSQKLAGVPDLAKGPLITGRYIREASTTLHAEAEGGLQQAAEHITRQVNSKVPGLNAKPIVEKGIGGILLGFILREQ
jgi:hypothetical protein